jgi:replicative DNA helicase
MIPRFIDNLPKEQKLNLLIELEESVKGDYQKYVDSNKATIVKISEYQQQAQKIAENPFRVTGVTTGFSKLDRILCGFDGGDLIIVGAETSVGKSLFTASMVDNSYRGGMAKSTLIFNLEMKNERYASRFAQMSEGTFSLPIYFFDNTKGATIDAVDNAIAKVDDLGLVVIDHLHYFNLANSENEAAQIGRITRRIKELAIKYNIPIILISHTRRQPAGMTKKPPTIDDLLGSSRIGQDADTIITLDRDDDGNERDIISVYVRKNRNKGTTGKVQMKIDFSNLRFYEL